MKITLAFIILIISSKVMSDELTLYSYPPKQNLSWSSPKETLTKFLAGEVGKILLNGDEIKSIDEWGNESTISEYYKSSMGHTIAHIKCTDSKNQLYDKWVSFSGQNFLSVDKDNILKKKIGLGVLFYDYIDGHIISGEENIKRLIYYEGAKTKNSDQKNSPRYLQYKIGTKGCDELISMVEFFNSFHFDPKATLKDLEKRPDEKKLYYTVNIEPYESYMNRMHDPKAPVGGGCAPFAVGLLKAAGLFDPFFDENWRLNIDVSEKLIGTKNKPIALKKLLFGKLATSWTHPGYNSRRMSIYDPKKMWRFIGEVNECIKTKKTKCSDDVLPWVTMNENRLKSGEVISYSDVQSTKKKKSVNIEGIVVE